jgi:hypothetical protein
MTQVVEHLLIKVNFNPYYRKKKVMSRAGVMAQMVQHLQSDYSQGG